MFCCHFVPLWAPPRSDLWQAT